LLLTGFRIVGNSPSESLSLRDTKRNVVYEGDTQQVKLKHGDEEIRFEQEPFPLYPGEKLVGKVSPLQVVAPNTALRLKALRDFVDGDTQRQAGDEWLFRGPGTYYPRVEVQVTEIVRAIIIKPNQALRLRARKEVTFLLSISYSFTTRHNKETETETETGKK
jgi:major vault protein